MHLITFGDDFLPGAVCKGCGGSRIGAIIGYCTQNKQPIPDWKGCGFTQLKPFLVHLAGQNRIRFVGDHIVHPDNEEGSIDIVGYDEDENSEDADESIVPAQLNRSTSSTVVTHAKAISSPKLNKSSSFSKSAASSGKLVPCPVCQSMMAEEEVNRHLDECLNLQMLNNEQNGANNAANNTAAAPNNTNPRTTAPVAAGTLLSQLTGADEDVLAHTRRGHRGAAIQLGKRRRSAPVGRTFAPNKRARIFYEHHEEEEDSEDSEDEEDEQEEERLVNNNNNRLLFVPEVQQHIPAVPVNNQTHHVHLSDDSDDEDNANNAQGGGDSRFAEKILDRTLADKECIICYMAMEKGQLVVTLPCFCQFHKECLLDWFSKREVCPTHSEMSM